MGETEQHCTCNRKERKSKKKVGLEIGDGWCVGPCFFLLGSFARGPKERKKRAPVSTAAPLPCSSSPSPPFSLPG